MKPQISIIIRTHNRPTLLRQALESVANQTLKNDVEVIVVEDGPAASQAVIEQFSRLLQIKHVATMTHVGRTKAANIGLEISSGQYINFLDDDDVLLPHHIETMLQGFHENPKAAAVHAAAVERKISIVSLDPLEYKIRREYVKHNQPLTNGILFHQNMFPIQAVMFKRQLYEIYGGMDEQLDLLEDWDLWIKYSLHGQFHYIDSITSIYHIPSTMKNERERENRLFQQEKILKEKYKEHIKLHPHQKEALVKKLSRFYKSNGLWNTLRKIAEVVGKKLH